MLEGDAIKREKGSKRSRERRMRENEKTLVEENDPAKKDLY